jgi:hypothetical protein
MILKIFSPKKFGEKFGVLKKLIITLVEKRQFFRRKLEKIAENCDHNIDPWEQFYKRGGQCYDHNFLRMAAEKIAVFL